MGVRDSIAGFDRTPDRYRAKGRDDPNTGVSRVDWMGNDGY